MLFDIYPLQWARAEVLRPQYAIRHTNVYERSKPLGEQRVRLWLALNDLASSPEMWKWFGLRPLRPLRSHTLFLQERVLKLKEVAREGGSVHGSVGK